MRLDATVVGRFVLLFRPRRYVRVTPTARAKSPLGMGFGDTRFASPQRTFKLLYIAKDIATGIAEAIIRDRFEGETIRELMMSEITEWGATEVTASRPLRFLDVRGAACLALGVSTDIRSAKRQDEARQFSQDVHDQTDLDGFLYRSRLTGRDCAAVYERAVTSSLRATPVIGLPRLAALIPALEELRIDLIA